MNNCIINRGPDAGGAWIDSHFPVVLGHRRLAIMDLTDAGAQPFVSASGKHVMVYNGEIYNKELLEEHLKHAGFAGLRGHSDTELLIESIEYLGIDKTLELIKGMWAFAILDRDTGSVTLSRDRFGEKPLYYGLVDGELVFASSLDAIKASGVSLRLQTGLLELYLQYGYIPAPYTIYENIYKLKTGTYLTTMPDYNSFRVHTYYDVKLKYKELQGTFIGDGRDACDELEKRLRSAVCGQMVSDVPLGAFLSGGIDSSLVVSLMQSVSSTPVKTFTIGFEQKGYNEADIAKAVSAHLGTEHTELYVGYKDICGIIGELPGVFGEPFADSSALPTMLVSRLTREKVTVSLSGDGGDELFAGYNTYRDAADGIRIMQGKLPFIKGALRRYTGKLVLASPLRSIPLWNTLGRCFAINSVEDFYRMVRDDDVRIHRLPLKSITHRERLITELSEYKDGYLSEPLNNLMLMDILQYLPDDILTKVDRAGMYYSLESRIPLLDRDVADLAFSLPLNMKLQSGVTKLPMRELLYRYVPRELIDRPKKGFSVPLREWLHSGELRSWAEDILVTGRPLIKDMLDVRLIDSMWKNYIEKNEWTVLLWYILMLEQWLIAGKE